MSKASEEEKYYTMNSLPEKVNSIRVRYRREYIINEDEETKVTIRAEDEITDGPVTNKIVERRGEFVNGYKLVRFRNGQYGYVREHDLIIMPYRYDVATEFNEYGYAMVGRDSSVAWIDKDFNYFSKDGMVEDKIHDCGDGTWIFDMMKGWNSINKFSDGDIPLSRLGAGLNRFVYFGTDGEIKRFRRYDSEKKDSHHETYLIKGSDFNEYGYAMAEGTTLANPYGVILFAEGFYVDFDALAKIAIEDGLVNSIHDEVKIIKKVRK